MENWAYFFPQAAEMLNSIPSSKEKLLLRKPAHSFPHPKTQKPSLMCFLVPSIQTCSLSPNGLTPSNSSLLVSQALSLSAEIPAFRRGQEHPSQLPPVSAFPLPKFTAQPLPPSRRPKFHALPVVIQHAPLS